MLVAVMMGGRLSQQPEQPTSLCSHDFFSDLAFYYIKNRVDQIDFDWQNSPNFPTIPENPDKCCIAITKLVQKFENDNKSELSYLMWEFPLTTQTGYASFMVFVKVTVRQKLIAVNFRLWQTRYLTMMFNTMLAGVELLLCSLGLV